MAGIADGLVDVLRSHVVLVVPDTGEVIGCLLLPPRLLLGHSGREGIAQTLDERQFHLIACILDEIPVVVGLPVSA